MTSSGSFHITIATHPAGLNLNEEFRLLKAALLYADHVTLYSITASSFMMLNRFGDLPLQYQLATLERVIPFVQSPHEARELLIGLRRFKALLGNKHASRQERVLMRNLEVILRQQWREIHEKAAELARDADVPSLAMALQSGLLDLHTFNGTDTDAAATEFFSECVITAATKGAPIGEARDSELTDKMIWEFVYSISDSVRNSATHPLFDDQTGALVSSLIELQKVAVSGAAAYRAQHVGLAANLVQYLPSFEDATIAEVLDIRRELAASLVRFRQAIVKFSEDIKALPWDEDFATDVQKVFQRDVAPAVLEIEDATKANKYLAALVRGLVTKPFETVGAVTIAAAVCKMTQLPDNIVLSLGLGASVAAVVYKAFDDWKQKRQLIEQNNLYFYYRAGKLMQAKIGN